jgi:hypothetical protein
MIHFPLNISWPIFTGTVDFSNMWFDIFVYKVNLVPARPWRQTNIYHHENSRAMWLREHQKCDQSRMRYTGWKPKQSVKVLSGGLWSPGFVVLRSELIQLLVHLCQKQKKQSVKQMDQSYQWTCIHKWECESECESSMEQWQQFRRSYGHFTLRESLNWMRGSNN